MRYLLAPDSFKEAASAHAVAEAMRRGVLAGDPDAECRIMPLSDGGEGLTAALVETTGANCGRRMCTMLWGGRSLHNTGFWATMAPQDLAMTGQTRALR